MALANSLASGVDFGTLLMAGSATVVLGFVEVEYSLFKRSIFLYLSCIFSKQLLFSFPCCSMKETEREEDVDLDSLLDLQQRQRNLEGGDIEGGLQQSSSRSSRKN